MSAYYEEVPFEYPKERQHSTDKEFVGDGWSVQQVGKRCFFEFISGGLDGKLKRIEISESDFEHAKSGQLSFEDLCLKYDESGE